MATYRAASAQGSHFKLAIGTIRYDFRDALRTRSGGGPRASGRRLGHPKGSLRVSRLDGTEDEIRRFLKLGVSKTAIAKITGVSRTALYSFMTTRGLRPAP